jgi:3'(2'), 5'-bisphosphate nucleotidase
MNSQLSLRAVEAAITAGDAILKVYQSDFEVAEKADGSPLTIADQRAHGVIAQHLAAFDIPILSEEGKDIPYPVRKHWKRLWIVDPLDGTKEFIHRRGEFTVNIALAVDGRPQLGVICLPVQRTLYYADPAHGAYRFPIEDIAHGLAGSAKDSDARLHRLLAAGRRLPEIQRPAQVYTIIGSRSHGTDQLNAFVDKQRRRFGEIDFISAGSALKFCRVAEGRADVYPRFGPTMEWDTAAGQAVAEAAGAAVVDMDRRRPLRYNKADLLNPWFIVERNRDG